MHLYMFKPSVLIHLFRALTPLISYTIYFHLAAFLKLETLSVISSCPSQIGGWREEGRQAGREGGQWVGRKQAKEREGKLAICPTNLSRMVIS